jgi:GT2 family glycosyltransferase
MREGRELPKVTALVLSYNGKDYMDDCIGGLISQDYPVLEILVVDNKSSDDTMDYVEERFPGVRTLRLEDNEGFAAGVNKGIMHCTGDLILVLNQDIALEKDVVSELVSGMQESGADVCSPKILYHQTERIWYAGGEITLFRKGNLRPKPTSHRGKMEKDCGQYDSIAETGYATGCAVLIKKELLVKLGGFDTSFFMYHEDADLSLRAKNTGARIVYVPDAVIYHKVSINRLDKFTRRGMSRVIVYFRSSMIFVKKHWKIRGLILWLATLPVRILLSSMTSINERF